MFLLFSMRTELHEFLQPLPLLQARLSRHFLQLRVLLEVLLQSLFGLLLLLLGGVFCPGRRTIHNALGVFVIGATTKMSILVVIIGPLLVQFHSTQVAVMSPTRALDVVAAFGPFIGLLALWAPSKHGLRHFLFHKCPDLCFTILLHLMTFQRAMLRLRAPATSDLAALWVHASHNAIVWICHLNHEIARRTRHQILHATACRL
mmetsp:Transcript_87508/g.139039  ORF Transcript_87508/g.139039 Transcript_87508/m.139039 type:complete len:204 (-) Transcript_87508:220-831(-)